MAKKNSENRPGLYYQGFGGIEEVAGSKHIFLLKKADGSIEKILHDCGNDMKAELDKDKEIEIPEKDELPFTIDNIDVVVFSHGHFDHVGDAWKLMVHGYKRPYFATEPTKEIIKLQLEEQVNFEWYKYERLTKRMSEKEKKNVIRPRLTKREISGMIESFSGMKYGTRVGLTNNIDAVFYDAGHIIGSAQVLYKINNDGRIIKLLTCVDLGRSKIDVPIIKEPYKNFQKDIDYAFIEATYGGKIHKNRQDSREELEEIILKAYENKKRVLIGAFAIMRTHQILSDLFWMYKRGKLPEDFKIFYDCKTAYEIFDIIKKHPECYDEEARKDFENSKENPSKFPNLKFVAKRAESQELDFGKPPYIIASSSGMFSMGRVVGHTKNHIEREDTVIILTGYQAVGTVGRQLEEGKTEIKIEGELYNRKAEIIRMRGYGAHADGEECVDHIVNNVKPRKGVYIVHGEEEQLQWTQRELKKRLPSNVFVEIVRKGKTYRILPYSS